MRFRALWRALLFGTATAAAAAPAAVSTLATLSTLDVAYRGEPFCWGPINAADLMPPMDYAYQGDPFVVVIT